MRPVKKTKANSTASFAIPPPAEGILSPQIAQCQKEAWSISHCTPFPAAANMNAK
jgi:hypothetical protein